jgi:hypothetical protein
MKGGTMRLASIAALAVLLAVAAVRGTAPAAVAPLTPASWSRDPLVPPSVPIVGRAVSGHTTYLLTANAHLIAIDFAARRVTSHPLNSSSQLWGLASTAKDAFLWTLAGRSQLVQITTSGGEAWRRPMRVPHLGIFSGPGFVVYQPVPSDVPGPALWKGAPGSDTHEPFGRLNTRIYPGLVRPEQWALNLAICGVPSTSLVPCWIRTSAVVDLISPTGTGELVTLSDIARPAVPVTDVETVPRPVRDVLVTASGDLLVLASLGDPQHNGRSLRRYGRSGVTRWALDLHRRARVFLQLVDRDLWLLDEDGIVLSLRLEMR